MARIAFTGCSSTGKTTSAKLLMESEMLPDHDFVFLTADARAILEKMGFQSMDAMRPRDLKVFQSKYFEEKVSVEEGFDHFLTDRSFVDVAAYSLVRDAIEMTQAELCEIKLRCEEQARKYDHHFYFPQGQIAFEDDGYRPVSESFHQNIDRKIVSLLREWGIVYTEIKSSSKIHRVRQIAAKCSELSF